ncbi:MAG: AMP-binding protein, partial [Pseudomonadota bacterium]
MNEKSWLDQYPEGVPAEIDMTEFSSVVDIFDQSCQRFGPNQAYTNFGKSITYADVDRQSKAFGAYLQSLGLERGDRVAIMMPNLLQYPIALFGILRAGLVVVNTNPLYTARELKHQLNDSGAKAIVVLENFAHTLQSVLEDSPVEHVFVTGVGDMLGFPKGTLINFVLRYVKKEVPGFSIPGAKRFSEALSAGASMNMNAPEMGHDDIAFLQYTGG